MIAPQPIHELKAGFFRALGHPLRVRIVEVLREGDRSAGELRALLDIDSSSASQHLAALRRHGIVEGVKEGTSVRYSVRDPLVFELFEVARQILSANLTETMARLEGLHEPERTPGLDEGGGSPE
ncbi:MAG: ArsR/SmtB family transcription factor [Thermoleophilia bacterium]